MISTERGILAEVVAEFANTQWSKRRAAEDVVEQHGSAAVPELIDALTSPSAEIRWGAAKMLGAIGDEAAAPALALALEDSDGGVRWLAAGALVRIGEAAVPVVLRRLISGHDSPWLHEGAHHVLRELSTPDVSPVVRALEGSFASTTVPVAANEALGALARR